MKERVEEAEVVQEHLALPRTSKRVKSWTFPEDYPECGGKKITVRRPTAAEERDILVAQDATFTGAMMESVTARAGRGETSTDVKIRVAQDCIESFDGHPVKDDERQQVWEEELGGWGRSTMLQWLAHCMTPLDEDAEGQPRKAPFLLP